MKSNVRFIKTLATLALIFTLTAVSAQLDGRGGKGKMGRFADGDGKCDSSRGHKGLGRFGGMIHCPEFVDANKDGKCDICSAKIDSLKAAGWTKEDFRREMAKFRPRFPKGFPDSTMREFRMHMKDLRDSLRASGLDRDEIMRELHKRMPHPAFADSIMKARHERMKAIMDSLKEAGADVRGKWMHPPMDGDFPDTNMRERMRMMKRFRPCPCAWLHHIGEVAPTAGQPAKLQFELGNPYPVPAGEKLNMTVSIEGAAPATIELYDANGKLIRSVFSGELKKGENKFSTETRDLQAGTYILKATVAGQTTSKNVVINK